MPPECLSPQQWRACGRCERSARGNESGARGWGQPEVAGLHPALLMSPRWGVWEAQTPLLLEGGVPTLAVGGVVGLSRGLQPAELTPVHPHNLTASAVSEKKYSAQFIAVGFSRRITRAPPHWGFSPTLTAPSGRSGSAKLASFWKEGCRPLRAAGW
jgi:hypothetical protein